ncbi:MAG: ABC transporter permease [Candidatus Bathyarchaeota archaeon]|nr:MAG: ABC transporter permease [Candidatus Bathyarchaeota archaeon]
MSLLRVFFSSALFSFRAQFGWLYPPMWLTMKLVMSLSQMAFFVFVGQFLITTGNAAQTNLIAYIAIGNSMSVLSWNTIFSVVNITSHDKWDGTLPLVLATPAHRLPLFVGRAMMHVFDGMLSVIISFIYAIFLFGVNFGNANILALMVVVFITALTMAGFGLMIGGLSFYYRNPLVFANIFTFVLLIFCGVNFPIQELPQPLQIISYIFPLTYGVDAGRKAIAGATLFEISSLLCQMLIVGFFSIMIGYTFFRFFERMARKTGQIEAI